ncbi:hypothetical protein NKI63_29890 [Mesorhizobium sp. M0410]|uniref:hypothetical protein n=1 Tax=Mesorhizobium sp. M0410 TaxID=2956943 RepID=UPI003336056F
MDRRTALQSRRCRVLVLIALMFATPAHLVDMAFFVENQRSQAAAVEMFSHNRETVWPGGDQVF